MIKLRVFPLFFNIEWKHLGQRLLDAKYNEEEARGFIVTDISDKQIMATYYEKIIYLEIVHHPVRGDFEITREVFFKTDIILFKKICFIVNPSRRFSGLLIFIANKTEAQVSIRDCRFNIPAFCDLGFRLFDEFNVTKVVYKQFNVTDSLKCSAAFSCDNNVFNEIGSVRLNIPAMPSRITFAGIINKTIMKGDISETGLISLSSANIDCFVDFINKNQDSLIIC
ncbi:hypothetical protein [Desulfolutivibrio sp.]|uniref:hypothetical protein n=1 Tax=Desulfolutivibrio sp. TaxID=2773296 RepID=UPI002F9672BF